MSLSIFCSYSHREEDFRNELRRRLFTLQQTGAITQWHDRRIEPGEEWRGQIDPHLRSAQIILFLVSADFLASDYCYDIEIKFALQRHAQGQAVVIPIMVRPVEWTTAPFAHLQILPSDGKPMISRSDRDQVFAEIAIAIPDIAMRLLPPTVQLSVQRSQILTPGLVQMVTMLQLNRLELKDMILNEMAKNPALEIATQEPSQAETYPFEKIDFGSYFDQYLDPGFHHSASESRKSSFETLFSSRVTLRAHLQSQLNRLVLSEPVRQAAHAIVSKLEENGYLMTPLKEIDTTEGLSVADMQAGLKIVQSLEPKGIGARNLDECLLLQLEARGLRESVAWKIVHDHLKLLASRQLTELTKVLGRSIEDIQIALNVIRHLDPVPGLRYFGASAPQVEPDVYITKEGNDYIVTLNDHGIPQLRLNIDYQQMIDREQEPNRHVRNHVEERYDSALQLIKNIEQRKQTILRVCQAIVRRQGDFLELGIDHLKLMMIKGIAEEIGVHPSTVSRAVANKWARTPQGVLELSHFFSEGAQGPSGSAIPILMVKRRVQRMIEEEDSAHPLTDEQITARLSAEGIEVTRRMVAKYREEMNIPPADRR